MQNIRGSEPPKPCPHVVVWVHIPFLSFDRIFLFCQTQMLTHHMVSKAICCNMATLLVEHINKWESALHMDGYYVARVIAIPYLELKCIISIVYKEERTYLVSIAHNSQCTCDDYAKISSMTLGK